MSEYFRKGLPVLLALALLTMAFGTICLSCGQSSGANGIHDVAVTGTIDIDGPVGEIIVDDEDPAPEGVSYLLFDQYGGSWADAEKRPGDDGPLNPAPVNPGEEDDLMCWAAAISNMLEYSGWGYVHQPALQTMEQNDADWIFQYYQDHIHDDGGFIRNGLGWWFTDFNEATGEDVPGGEFWPATLYPWENYVTDSNAISQTMQFISSHMTAYGSVMGLSIRSNTAPGHAITCWGYAYDPTVNPLTDPHNYYLGIWTTDSDSDKGTDTPPDKLTYNTIDWDSTNGRWKFTSGYDDYFIVGATALKPFPENRPVAKAGTSYTGLEGREIVFNGGSSTDSDSTTLYYRWDFDGDGEWDTDFSTSSTASKTYPDEYVGTAYLQVLDGQLMDVDSARVTVRNVQPIITGMTSAEIFENEVAEISGTIVDSGTLDTFTLQVTWGDGYSELVNFPAGTTTFTLRHQYLDDGGSGTAYDDYQVMIDIADGDGAISSTWANVRVNNIAPVILILSAPDCIENRAVTLVCGFKDQGTLDTFTINVNWGDGTIDTYTNVTRYNEFRPVHYYLDDDPTGTPYDYYPITVTLSDDDGGSVTKTTPVKVNNAAPTISSFSFPPPINENRGVYVNGTYYDQGYDQITITIDWADGFEDTQYFEARSGSFSFFHRYLDDTTHEEDWYFAQVRIQDDDLSFSEYFKIITVLNVAPVISEIVGGEYREGQSSELYVSFDDPGMVDFHQVMVNWGDGSTETFSVPFRDRDITLTHQYSDDDPTGTHADEYTVQVTVMDDDGGSATSSTWMVVINVDPSVVLTPVSERDHLYLTIDIIDPGADFFRLAVSWGDGSDMGVDWSGERTMVLEHSYERFQTYEIEVTVVDDDGGEGRTVISYDMTIPNHAPVASFTITPSTILNGGSIRVDASATSDFEDSIESLKVRWDWNDDGTWDTDYFEEKIAEHRFSYLVPGVYTIRMEVLDTAGASTVTSRSFTILNNAPIASFTVTPSSIANGGSISVDASACSDFEESIESLLVRWDWNDDGDWDTDYSAEKTASYQYSGLVPGVYTIRMEVLDTAGASTVTSRSFTILNNAPIASFILDQTNGPWSTVFGVDASGCSDLDQSASSLEVRWDWNDDGMYDTAWTTVKVASHAYGMVGEFTIRLQVRDAEKALGSTTLQVSTSNAVPAALLAGSPEFGNGATPFLFDASGSTDADHPFSAMQFRWSVDGVVEVDWSADSTLMAQFMVDGLHVITVEVRDPLGGNDDAQFTILMDGTAPTTTAVPSGTGSNGWFNSDVNVMLSAVDPGQWASGDCIIWFSVNGGAESIFDDPVMISDEGTTTISYYAIDRCGNVESAKYIEVMIDRVPPETTLSIDSVPCSVGSSASVLEGALMTLVANDALSGSASSEYSFSSASGPWTSYQGAVNLPLGQYVVYYRSVDLAGNIEATNQVTVEVVSPIEPTTLQYTGALNGQYSDMITLSATLMNDASEGVYGKVITFALGVQAISAITDANGVASVTMVIGQPSGTVTLSILFAGDEDFTAASTVCNFVISGEDASLSYSGDTIVLMTDTGIDLRATFIELDDGYWGDLTKVSVTFSIYSCDMATLLRTAGPKTISITPERGVGVAKATVSGLAEGNYIVKVSFESAGHYSGASSDPVTITMVNPTGTFVTGAGVVLESDGDYGSFAFVIRYDKRGAVNGFFSYLYEENEELYLVVSSKITGLGFISNHAFFEGWCTVYKYNEVSGLMSREVGVFKFRVDCWDNSATNSRDIFHLSILDPYGVVFHEVDQSSDGTLIGNIRIHRPKK